MTAAIAARPTTSASSHRAKHRSGPFLAALPWLIPAVALVLALVDTGVSGSEIIRYTAYFALGVVVPGTLVYRASRGSRGNLPEDIGLGAATGLLLLIIGWALAAATSLQFLLPAWPLLVIALFAAVPGLRRHWRIAEPQPLPLRWSWIIAGALVVVVMLNYPGWTQTPLPPVTAQYYQDLMYHLALVHEMTRSMPFQVPQLVGDTLRYHYLSDADMAAASMITGIAPATVLLRLWIVPMTSVTVLLAAALGRELTGKWWAGALAGAAAIVGLPLALGAVQAFGPEPVSPFSPSQTYAFPLLGLLLMLAVDLLRGRPLRYGWALVFPLALASAGAKSSALPPLVAGLVLAGLVLLVTDRTRIKGMLAFSGLVLAAMLVGLKIFAGGGAGTLGVQPFSLLWWFPPYATTLGVGEAIDGDRLLPSGVAGASSAGLVFLAGLVVWWLIVQAPRLIGVLSIGAAGTRRDPVAWMFAGLTVAGAGAAWVFWHPSASQLYFYLTVIPFAAVLSVWFLAEHTRSLRPVIAGLIAGAVWIVVVPHPAEPAKPTFRSWAWALGAPILLTAAVAAAVAAVGLLAWRARTGRLAWRAVPIALVAATLGAGIGHQVAQQVRFNAEALTEAPPPAQDPNRIILRDEMAAALWINQHAGNDDVVATNVHCNPITWKAGCDARAFWVAGLGGRRTVVESWAYTDQTVALDGVGGLRYARQPAPYPQRFALNQRVFTKADPADLAELKRQFGVRWLLGDTRALGGVSPRLAQAATVRYTAGPVTVYELS